MADIEKVNIPLIIFNKIQILTNFLDKGILDRPWNFVELFDDWDERIQWTTQEWKMHIEGR